MHHNLCTQTWTTAMKQLQIYTVVGLCLPTSELSLINRMVVNELVNSSKDCKVIDCNDTNNTVT